MIKRSKIVASILGTAAMLASTVALAGEIKGPPPPLDSLPGPPGTRISNGESICSFSGLNDTPGGFGTPGSLGYDPGGIAQSYGYFMAQFGLFDPSDPADRDNLPGTSCNPTIGPRLPH